VAGTGLGGGVCLELLRCHGHPNVQLQHGSTLELDASPRLTPRGDCVACVGCRGEGKCAERPGLAAFYLAVFSLEDPIYAGLRIYGFSPGVSPTGRMVIRKSLHRRDSVIIGASLAARDVPSLVRRLLASSFARCLALHVVLELDVEAEDILPRSVVEDPHDGNYGSS